MRLFFKGASRPQELLQESANTGNLTERLPNDPIND